MENCLLYPQGDIQQAVKAIERICNDEELREKLYRGGIETARSRGLGCCSKRYILALYFR